MPTLFLFLTFPATSIKTTRFFESSITKAWYFVRAMDVRPTRCLLRKASTKTFIQFEATSKRVPKHLNTDVNFKVVC